MIVNALLVSSLVLLSSAISVDGARHGEPTPASVGAFICVAGALVRHVWWPS
jgi:hypothetical protein